MIVVKKSYIHIYIYSSEYLVIYYVVKSRKTLSFENSFLFRFDLFVTLSHTSVCIFVL